MLLTRVKLLNFRNLEKVDLAVSPRINIFLGRNGQGKTNLLEGMSYLALARSHRGSRDRELIQFGAERFHLTVDGEDSFGDFFRLEAAVSREGEKRVKADGEIVRRNADLVGRLSTVNFNPDEVDLTKGPPDQRRKFLDYTLCLTSSEYFRNLIAYRRALAQKNRLLRTRHGVRDEEFDVWDAELVQWGAPLVQARIALLGELEMAAATAYSGLAPRGGTLRISLISSVTGTSAGIGETPSVDHVDALFREALRAGRARERAMGFAQLGPHRDRLEIGLEGRPLRRYASQGEMRSAAIALKLGQAELIFARTKTRPVVFLDDIFSELDRGRVEALQDSLHRDHQLFVATARVDDVIDLAGWEEVKAWHVEGGRVQPLEHAASWRAALGHGEDR